MYWILMTVALCQQYVWSAPSFYNLPNSRSVDENLPADTEVITIEVSDDAGNDLRVWWEPSPADGSRLFTLGPVGSNQTIVTTSLEIDFEDLTSTSFVFTVYLTDNTSLTATNTLTLSVRDLNEPLIWIDDPYTTSVPDGAAVGFAVQDPGLAIVDPDVGDTVSCSMDCPGNEGMSQSCNITVTLVYSLDDGLSDSVICSVEAVDDGLNTATASLTISIDDVNNFTPSFAPVSYQFTVSPYDPVDTAVGTVTATDGDTGDYGKFSYSMDQSAYPTHYFKIDSSSGAISTQLDMSTCDCPLTTFSIPVHATDQGGLVGSGVVHITTLTTTTTPATTTTTTPTTMTALVYKTFFDSRVNVIWFTLLMVLIFFTTCVTVIILVKYVLVPTTHTARKTMKAAFNKEGEMDTLPGPKSKRLNYGVRNYPKHRSLQPWRHDYVFQ